MINPQEITNFNRTQSQLEELALFCIIVAGKKSGPQAIKLEAFLNDIPVVGNLGLPVYPSTYWESLLPFAKIRKLSAVNLLETQLKKHKLGQYTRIAQAWEKLAVSGFDLTTVTPNQLETIPGIGPKTSRFFVMHSRPNQRVATIDTHILKFLRSIGYTDAPKSTPTGKVYEKYETIFLDYADSVKRNPAELDLEIWKSYAVN
jgi:hypothetical protein